MNKFMKEAIKEATKGIECGHGGPFGCVIVKDNKIIARGHNEVLKRNDATCHGEMVALRKAMKKLNTFDLSGTSLYTTGEPCPMCMGAILWSNISKVYYGCTTIDTEIIGFRDEAFYNFDRSTFLEEIDRDECLKLYEKYKNIKDKIPY